MTTCAALPDSLGHAGPLYRAEYTDPATDPEPDSDEATFAICARCLVFADWYACDPLTITELLEEDTA